MSWRLLEIAAPADDHLSCVEDNAVKNAPDTADTS